MKGTKKTQVMKGAEKGEEDIPSHLRSSPFTCIFFTVLLE